MRVNWLALAKVLLLACAICAGQALIALPLHAASSGAPVAPTLVFRSDETSENIRRAIEAMSRDGREINLRFLPAEAQSPARTPDAILAAAQPFETFAAKFEGGIRRGLAGWPALADVPADWRAAWAENTNGAPNVPVPVRLTLVFVLALAVWAAARKLLKPQLSRRPDPQPATGGRRIYASLLPMAGEFLAVIAFAATIYGLISWLLPQDDLARRLARVLANAFLAFFTYRALGLCLLSPGDEGRRVVMLPRAEHHFNLLMLYAVLGPVVVVAVSLVSAVASNRAAIEAAFLVLGASIAAYKIWWFWDGRADIASLILAGAGNPQHPGFLRASLSAVASYVYMLLALAMWIVAVAMSGSDLANASGQAAGLTQLLIVLTPLMAYGAGLAIKEADAASRTRRAAGPVATAFYATMETAVYWIVWVIAGALLYWIWTPIFAQEASAPTGRIIARIAAAAGAAFAGWLAFTFLRVLFTALSPKPVASQDEEAVDDTPASRLATVLPALRGLVLGSVLGLTLLFFLSSLGVDVGPLLAGFGILGLAISFGSQALVRDIVSGIFFMVEDAFRVGEYIDTGRLKGTVEKISLRSLQLRHSSGLIHTVPFGQISAVTNGSRDWATVKFNIRLDHAADIEKTRKIIKKLGIAMHEDADIGPGFISPLKLQGVSEITDSAIVLRLKFTAKPAQSSVLQRECLKRVYAALTAGGVPFASNAVTVRGAPTPDNIHAAASAAQDRAAPPLAAS